MTKYTIKAKEVWRPYSTTGYIYVHGGGPDPNSTRQRNKKKVETAANVQRTNAMANVRMKTVSRLAKRPNQRYENSTRPVL